MHFLGGMLTPSLTVKFHVTKKKIRLTTVPYMCYQLENSPLVAVQNSRSVHVISQISQENNGAENSFGLEHSQHRSFNVPPPVLRYGNMGGNYYA